MTKARDIVLKMKDVEESNSNSLKLIKIEEVANCRTCRYNRTCPVPREKLRKLREEARKAYDKEVIKGAVFQDEEWKRGYETNFETVFWPDYIRFNLTGKCEYEIKEVMKVEKFMQERYDLSEPKVFLLSRETMKSILHAYRCDIILAMQGMLIQAQGKYGPYDIVNPMIRARQEYSKIIVESIETLDRVVEGQKVDIKLNAGDILRKLDLLMDDQKGIIDTTLDDSASGGE